MVCLMPTPTATGTTPATAETWETSTYTSALTTGRIAETTPKATDVSHASTTPPQVTGAGYRPAAT